MASTGLAFSGGGIRSAAFCSGVLRRLLEREVEMDYLSCVSGGGYTGTAYLDWKYREERKKKMEGKEGEGKRDWHTKFFDHMTQRSGYICNWMEPCKGILDTIVFICVILLVTVIQPLIKWGGYACPLAFIMNFSLGDSMKRVADCDTFMANLGKKNSSATYDGHGVSIDRCESGDDQSIIELSFYGLFILSMTCYIISRLTQRLRIVLRVNQYIFGSCLLLTFIPYAMRTFFEDSSSLVKLLVVTIAVTVWMFLPLLRNIASYILIVYSYSFVIYWRVYNVKEDDLPLFHWLLFVSGFALWIAPFVTASQQKLVHAYNRWRLQKAFYHNEGIGQAGCLRIWLRYICHLWPWASRCEDETNEETRPLTLADLKGMKPEYLSNMVVNRWKKNDKCKDGYGLLTMSSAGIELLDWEPREKQFKDKLEPKDIMLSDAMATSAAAISTHMGKYDLSVEGLTRLYAIFGIEMGATMISNVKSLEKESVATKVVAYLINIVRGLPLMAVPILYYYGSTVLLEFGLVLAFFIIHLVLAIIAVIDTGAEKPTWWEKLARWFIVHNSFVYYAREMFCKINIGPTPPAVLLLSDGGHFENLAILPLLKRKLKRIVVVDGGYKEEDKDYGKSLLCALMLARAKLKCGFISEDGHDVTPDFLENFVKPQPGGNPRSYKFKVHYQSDEIGGDDEGEILLIVPRNPQPSVSDHSGSVVFPYLDEPDGLDQAMAMKDDERDGLYHAMVKKDEDVSELTLCCCECCHRKSCQWFSKIFCNVFPQHNTANQFFTPRMFSAYHREGYRACVEAEADGFLKDSVQPMSSTSRIGELVV